jgi:hypothetical protein
VGASPTRQPLQPEAIGAVMEVTKWLKPSTTTRAVGANSLIFQSNKSLTDRDIVVYNIVTKLHPAKIIGCAFYRTDLPEAGRQ